MRELRQTVVSAIKAASVPPLPQALVRLMQRTEDDSATIDDLAEIVKQDPGLAAHILTAANSAAMHRAGPIQDIRAGVTLLGTRLIRSIATCLAVQRLFDDEASGGSRADLTDFWRHSLLVAELAHALASATRYTHPDEAYLAGLLHNIGVPLLLNSLGDQYASILLQAADEDALVAAERTHLGTHHGEIGTWLADQWRLDSGLGDAILFHHAPADQITTATRLPQLVWLAEHLGRTPEPLAPLQDIASLAFGKDAPADLGALRQRALERANLIGQAVGLAPAAATAEEAPRSLPRLSARPPATPATAADTALGGMLGNMAVMHPLQNDLFGLEHETDLLLSLRESARILFELPRVGFLISDPVSGELAGRELGGQPPIFQQVRIAPTTNAGVALRAFGARAVMSNFDDPAQTDALLDRQFARAFSSEGILVVPMVGRRRTAGVMVFGLGRAQHARLKRRAPWLLNFGRIAGFSLEAWQDATALRRQAEDEAAAAFQRQARRVVHEAGNPLGIIKSYLRILDHKLPQDSGVKQELDILREEIDRVGAIVRRLSDTPSEATTGARTSATELVRELLALYGGALFRDRGIELATQWADGPLDVACDRDSLKQILLNLWKNAAEAMPTGGRFEIMLLDGVQVNGRQFAEIRMQDSGPGMPEAAVRALSFPDEVTGDRERGLGLSIVGRLAAGMGATVSCRSRAGTGTTLSLLVPATP